MGIHNACLARVEDGFLSIGSQSFPVRHIASIKIEKFRNPNNVWQFAAVIAGLAGLAFYYSMEWGALAVAIAAGAFAAWSFYSSSPTYTHDIHIRMASGTLEILRARSEAEAAAVRSAVQDAVRGAEG